MIKNGGYNEEAKDIKEREKKHQSHTVSHVSSNIIMSLRSLNLKISLTPTISAHHDDTVGPASKRSDHTRPSSRSSSPGHHTALLRTGNMLSHPTVGSWWRTPACCTDPPRVQPWHSLRFGQRRTKGSGRNHPPG
jgi:hypothetical protein